MAETIPELVRPAVVSAVFEEILQLACSFLQDDRFGMTVFSHC